MAAVASLGMIGLIFGGYCSNVRLSLSLALTEGQLTRLQVFALEAIVKYAHANVSTTKEDDTSKYHFLRLNQHRFQLTSTEGLLITFFQFLFTAVAAYPSQASFGKNTSAFGLKPPVVPIKRWALIAAMFWGINMLNNWAFAFNISVPVHM
ncbi:hypothetical protein LTR04_007321 [Oleoguttula sp. CCFEE 6159]|nr:hypothetical protein LTR04_007321 [Oleoguttula sp. CCFEE 6159]